MNGETAYTARALSVDERRASLAALVESGEITPEQAALIDFRDPPEAVREHARRLGAALRSRAEELLRAFSP